MSKKKSGAPRKPRNFQQSASDSTQSFAELPKLPPAEWRYVAFSDLHVSSATLDRALALLALVRGMARHYGCDAVCLGDFWDQRSTLAVRHLDLVQREFEKWNDENVRLIIVPGNHDQVSMDGTVNAVRIFDGFRHISVATEPYVDVEHKLAFLPWREEAGKQEELFNALSGSGWTIFAHAEVQGAIANSGKPAAGRVSCSTIEARARACYVGHYHKRQKLGLCTWYIGSPFEMNFGERDEPHGVAIVDSESVEPRFVDLHDFPKHHRFVWPDDAAKLAVAREQDIVEVYFKPSDLGGPALRQALNGMRARDVRPLPLAQDEQRAPVRSAFTLAEGMRSFAEEWAKAQVAAGAEASTADVDQVVDQLVAVGQHYLAQVPDARAVVPLSPQVRILGVQARNFCALKNEHRFDLRDLGPVLVRGRMGIGKTSLCDAITWCLYGATTPRKPGDRTGALRADDVIHDESDETSVRVEVTLLGADDAIVIERTKKRGQGAKLRLYGAVPSSLEGIADTQEIVHRIIGLDLDLWRATVYLGQGAAVPFIADGDKKRKELLSRALGLGACELAQKLVREEIKKLEADISRYVMRENEAQAGLDALAHTDFADKAAQWEEQKRAALDLLVKQGQEATAQIAQLDPFITQENTWRERRDAYDAHVAALTKSLAASASEDEVQRKLAAELGAAEAEHAIILRDIARLKVELQAMMQARATGQPLICQACGQALPSDGYDAHVGEHEAKLLSKQQEADQMQARVLVLRAQIDASKMGAAPNKSAIIGQLEEARAAYAKCVEALSAIARLKEARAAAERRLIDAREQWVQKSAETNPFSEMAQKVEATRENYRVMLEEAQKQLAEARATLIKLRAWEEGFGPKGVPVLVLRTVLHELETHVNATLAVMLAGSIYTRLSMDDDDLVLKFYEYKPDKGEHVERTFFQLSGGQRRCIELAFSPFALSEMIFARCGVRVGLLIVDELTTHLDQDTKPLLCNLLRALDRETVLVIDHDAGVQGAFDVIFDAGQTADGTFTLKRAS